MRYAVRIHIYAITQLLNTQYAFKTRKRNDFTTQLKPVLRYLAEFSLNPYTSHIMFLHTLWTSLSMPLPPLYTSISSLLRACRSSWKATPLRVTTRGLPPARTGPVCRAQVSEKTPADGDLKVKGKESFWPGSNTPGGWSGAEWGIHTRLKRLALPYTASYFVGF